MSPKEFAKVLAQQKVRLERNAKSAARANAHLTGSTVREHIARDDLPLEALSPEWVAFKLAGGFKDNHLWYTGAYLSNFDVVEHGHGFTVGTNRPARGFPTSRWNSLPELLEDRFPVWRLTLDEIDNALLHNAEQATRAALDGKSGQYKRQ